MLYGLIAVGAVVVGWVLWRLGQIVLAAVVVRAVLHQLGEDE